MGTNSARRCVISCRSSTAVSPAARMSLTSGSEIMPSGRTGTTRLSSSFFQTCTSRTSSGPMRKALADSTMRAGAAAFAAFAGAAADGAAVAAGTGASSVLDTGATPGAEVISASGAEVLPAHPAVRRQAVMNTNGRTVIVILPSSGPPRRAAESSGCNAARRSGLRETRAAVSGRRSESVRRPGRRGCGSSHPGNRGRRTRRRCTGRRVLQERPSVLR